MKQRMGIVALMALVPLLVITGCGSDSTTSVAPDTTPPLAPVVMGARGDAGVAGIWWNANNEPDLAGYNVYVTRGGVVQRANSVSLHQTFFSMPIEGGGSATMYITAVDHAGNESSPSISRTVSLSGMDQVEGPAGDAEKYDAGL